MTEPLDLEHEAVARDRALAWELFEARPEHPEIPRLALGVLARAPELTGMTILLAMHREACGEIDEARTLLRDLVGRRDRQYLNALRRLRDLEASDLRYAESLRLARLVLREDPEADWRDRMELATATALVVDPETGWAMMDDAVALSGRTDPDGYPDALGLRAAWFLTSGAPPGRFLVAAQQAIEADPTDASIATALGFAYLYDYRPEDAAELFRRVLREDPMNEPAQAGIHVAQAFLAPLESGAGTMEDIRAAGMGEMAWRVLRDKIFETGVAEALAALSTVLPDDLARSLRPPLDRETARASGGEDKVLAWHDGQLPGTGTLWREGGTFRLMTGDEVHAMDEAIEAHPEAWPQWDAEGEYYTQIFTDDAGAYVVEGTGGRLYRRSPGEADVEVAESLADWLWDRVVAFGGDDPRPGRSGAARGADAVPGAG